MAQIKQYTITEPYLNIKCKLGEGPHYNEKLKEFRFLDIDGKQMYASRLLFATLLERH